MNNHVLSSDRLETRHTQPDFRQRQRIFRPRQKSHRRLPALITKAASTQTYYTIRFLVDHDRIEDAYRAYAYFRMVDDWLDEGELDTPDSVAYVEQQKRLINDLYRGMLPDDLSDEEIILAELIQTDQSPQSGLRAYIKHMIDVMAFDARRKGQLISAQELDTYTHDLAVGVTEAMHYFIGHNDPSPYTKSRYLAVKAAHITHMLRDTYEDVETGYINIPREFLATHRIDPTDIESDAYRTWVKSRTKLARAYFKVGEHYLAQVKNRRCRLAGLAYTARFECVLDVIERDDYQLRTSYEGRKTWGGKLQIGWSTLRKYIRIHRSQK